MKSRVKYTDEALGKLKVVEDFLPRPEELVFKEDNVKITMSLSKSSVSFFKTEARKHHTSYQAMIRRLLDRYAAQYTKPVAQPSSGRGRR
ncbi:MAG: CopG family transcriptional regulator [Candidatus Muproteobacteria bacterium RIFCSPHIGHO2_02_FULL_65_16]|uniref:CopG family transcriptional regulator n=1 Tax=Candidatus Muproteobacteria bacterium RIFCSPHIGHO2_02_FULL_65_16 TaxID=1817766 RepID=A0A1F6U6U2_9PROT|nr:MAG: CopG family transcriptional regulator [Candidatus Muproteobacteria bacterium RIFCSPHIGHO2_02_FULL_65_16]